MVGGLHFSSLVAGRHYFVASCLLHRSSCGRHEWSSMAKRAATDCVNYSLLSRWSCASKHHLCPGIINDLCCNNHDERLMCWSCHESTVVPVIEIRVQQQLHGHFLTNTRAISDSVEGFSCVSILSCQCKDNVDMERDEGRELVCDEGRELSCKESLPRIISRVSWRREEGIHWVRRGVGKWIYRSLRSVTLRGIGTLCVASFYQRSLFLPDSEKSP